MTEIIVTPKEGRLVPASVIDLEEVEALSPGTYVAKLWRPRSINHLRWYFGLLHLIENSTDWNKDQIHFRLKIATGFVDDIIIDKDGSVSYLVKSVSYEKCNEREFTKFANAALDWLMIHVIPGVKRSEILKKISDMTGVDFNPAKEQ